MDFNIQFEDAGGQTGPDLDNDYAFVELVYPCLATSCTSTSWMRRMHGRPATDIVRDLVELGALDEIWPPPVPLNANRTARRQGNAKL